MPNTFTTNYNLTKPEVGSATNTWGGLLNADLDAIDAQMKTNADAAAAAQTTANSATTTANAAMPKSGGTFTGTVTISSGGLVISSGSLTLSSGALTLAADPNTNMQAATKQYVDALVAPKANIASPTFTGTPAAPTAAANTNTTQIATTAYVQGELTDMAPLASPAFTGNPTAPTQAQGSNNTRLATTAYVDGTFQRAVAQTIAGLSAYDVSNIPAWVKRITISCTNLSLSANNPFVVQLGAGNVDATSYSQSGVLVGFSAYSFATGFCVNTSVAGSFFSGHIILENLNGLTWNCSVVLAGGGYAVIGGGTKTLSGTLDRLRLQVTDTSGNPSGSVAFDAGAIAVFYE